MLLFNLNMAVSNSNLGENYGFRCNIALESGQIHVLQRKLHLDVPGVDLSLGKKNNRLDVARGNDFAITQYMPVRGNLSITLCPFVRSASGTYPRFFRSSDAFKEHINGFLAVFSGWAFEGTCVSCHNREEISACRHVDVYKRCRQSIKRNFLEEPILCSKSKGETAELPTLYGYLEKKSPNGYFDIALFKDPNYN